MSMVKYSVRKNEPIYLVIICLSSLVGALSFQLIANNKICNVSQTEQQQHLGTYRVVQKDD
jgi:hypothetical protein